VVNVTAAVLLGFGQFRPAGFVILIANIFDFIDGKVAKERSRETAFGGFWDSVLDRFSDITLFIGLIGLYANKHHTDFVIITALAMMFSVMTSYTRARAESIIEKCKVGFMERPERIVLFMIVAARPRPVAGVLLDRRARHLAVRPLGGRHPGIRLAHASRVDRRPDDLGPRDDRVAAQSIRRDPLLKTPSVSGPPPPLAGSKRARAFEPGASRFPPPPASPPSPSSSGPSRCLPRPGSSAAPPSG
jgi:phosphatidylglycerophosphate synthase